MTLAVTLNEHGFLLWKSASEEYRRGLNLGDGFALYVPPQDTVIMRQRICQLQYMHPY